jgi:hypothetical protein
MSEVGRPGAKQQLTALIFLFVPKSGTNNGRYKESGGERNTLIG